MKCDRPCREGRNIKTPGESNEKTLRRGGQQGDNKRQKGGTPTDCDRSGGKMENPKQFNTTLIS